MRVKGKSSQNRDMAQVQTKLPWISSKAQCMFEPPGVFLKVPGIRPYPRLMKSDSLGEELGVGIYKDLLGAPNCNKS